MPNKGKDDDEENFEAIVREEFKKLHRQYRLMEDARHAIAGATGKLSKQGTILSRLRSQKEDLLANLKNATSAPCEMKDKETIKTILEALQKYEKYRQDISSCLKDILEMESNVDRITQRLVEQRLKVQSLYGQSMTTTMACRKQKKLEEKLYLVTTQFDSLVTQNKALRQEINMMLKLRGKFYRRMMAIKKISARIKERIGHVVYEATNSYDQRDDWVTKTLSLRERNEKESKQHVLEIKEYHRILHHDEKIHNFLAIKNRARDAIETQHERSDRKNEKKIAELDALLATYKRSFRSILSLAKSDDIDALLNSYLEQEQKNYTKFKYITDLNHETNCLQEEIATIRQNIEELFRKMQWRSYYQEEILGCLDEQLDAQTKLLEDTLQEWKVSDKKMEEFGALLDDTFHMANCNNSSILNLLGNTQGMRPHNIGLCLQVLERRVSELNHYKMTLEVRKSVEIDGNPLPKKIAMWQTGIKPQPTGGPFKPQVHVTGRVDTEQDEEEDSKAWSERPVYYPQMNAVVQNKMKNQQKTNKEDSQEKNSLLSIAEQEPPVSQSTVTKTVSQSSNVNAASAFSERDTE